VADRYAYSFLAAPQGALVLIVNNGITIPVVHYVSSWTCNEIPTAICGVAVGVNLANGGISPVHFDETKFQLNDGAEAVVVFAPGGESSPGVLWPIGQQVVFRGRVAGVAAKTVNGQSMLTVHLVHWLSELSESSALTAAGHVGNSAFLTARAVQFTGSPAIKTGSLLSSTYRGLDLQKKAETDVFDAIYALYAHLASQSTMQFVPPGACQVATATSTDAAGRAIPFVNDLAVDAIERLKAGRDGAYGKALAIGGSAATRTARSWPYQVYKTIANMIGSESVVAFANVSLWDKLITGYCPELSLTVVPRVEDALIVPLLPVYDTDTPWKTLRPEHYDAVDMSGSVERALRGVGLTTAAANSAIAGTTNFEGKHIGGCYYSPAVTRGTFLIIPAPRWLSQLQVGEQDPAGANSSAVADLRNLRTRRASPSVGAAATGATVAPPDPTGVNGAFSSYAKAFYWQHAYRGRSGVVSGPLRFDISPGSTVRVDLPDHSAINGISGVSQSPVLGYVQRVTISIDCNAPSASTVLQMSHVRPVAPSGSLGSTEHPLYPDATFTGAPLLDAYKDF